ncbi:hypothetical protein JCM6882_004624 [Rhodosporidiobolus microsporus]
MQPSPSGGAEPRFRPRQSSYLRISPTTVLQMILYLEPAHTEWMNQNNVLERMLFALRDRIPLKLAQEGTGKKSGKEKSHVDVFRGADYQMAFFFRRANDKHVVLLKDKDLQYTSRPSQQPPVPKPAPPPPQPRRGNKRARAARSPSSSSGAPEARGGRGEEMDLRDAASDDDEGDEEDAPRASKRRAGAGVANADEDEDLVVVKPEPTDDEAFGGPAGSSLFEGAEVVVEEGGVKLEGEEIDEEVKPTLKVTYRGYRIFGRTLVVIVEPYPPLAASDLARPRLLQTEIRQLSASVAPEAYRSSSSAAAAAFRASTLSATPAPMLGAGRANPLFRRESTVGSVAESRGGTETPAPQGASGEGEDEDEQMRRLRESTEVFAAEGEMEEEKLEEDDDDDLPDPGELLGKKASSGGA